MAVHDTLPLLLPGNYVVQPESQRPRLGEVVTGAILPVIDMACPDRAAVVAAIGDACRSHGFFQVLNHGIDGSLIAAVMVVGRDFFRLPAAENAKLYADDDPAYMIRLPTSFNVHAQGDGAQLARLPPARLHGVLPLQHQPQLLAADWPSSSNLPDFKDTISTYCKQVRELGFRLYAAISDSLDLDATCMKHTLGEPEQHVAVNMYPQCPEPELTSGDLPAHTDPDALTILLMDHQDVAGLRPGALVVSVGDQLRALAKRSRDLCMDAVVEPRARPRLGGNTNSAAALGLGHGVFDPDSIVSVHALLCYSDGLVLPLENIFAAGETLMRSSPDAVLVQVRVDESVGAKATGKGDGRNNGRCGRRENLLGILGIMAASLAVTAVVPAAAGAITGAMAFGSAVLMFTGVSMAVASIRGA